MKKINPQDLSVGLISLGCPKNTVDSEAMLGKLGEAGFLIDWDVDNSDVVIINTCGFIEPAKQEAISEIKSLIKRKRQGFIKKVVVCGCLSQRMGEKLKDQIKGIDAIVGLADRDKIVEIVKGCFTKPIAGVYLSESGKFVSDDSVRLLTTSPFWAYLRISEGCNRKCTFCTIPYIRGEFRSKPMEMILEEANSLVQSGVKELSIIAQDSNYYGKDLGISNGLSKLLKELEKIEGLEWIRVMYLYPSTINDELIETIAKSSKILNYIDMPIQHINDEILNSMKRTDSRENTISLIKRIREAMPDAVIRSTLIVGFPGETQKQFDELLEFVKWAKFDALGCFPYYAEEGTEAAVMTDQVDHETKEDRVREIMLAQQEIVFAKNEKMIGEELTVLLDGMDQDGNVIGRYYGQAPHIDSICYVEGENLCEGDFIRVKVKDYSDYDLVVEKL